MLTSGVSGRRRQGGCPGDVWEVLVKSGPVETGLHQSFPCDQPCRFIELRSMHTPRRLGKEVRSPSCSFEPANVLSKEHAYSRRHCITRVNDRLPGLREVPHTCVSERSNQGLRLTGMAGMAGKAGMPLALVSAALFWLAMQRRAVAWATR